MPEYKVQLDQIKKDSLDFISEEELIFKLKKSIKHKTPLKIKVGFDPSYPDLHFGHLVLLKKLKLFQNLGHHIVFIIGDFTARIGDPSGQNEARPQLTSEQILKNTQTYTHQIFKILDKKQMQIVYNSSWMDRFLPSQWVKISSLYTVARMLERNDFSKRYKSKKPIYIHEFLYPLIQGYDSVEIRADVEIGGSDQIFNLLMGRELQKHFNQSPQCVLTFPLLKGLDGQKKMSKSFGNFIAFQDSPQEIYGKIMSLNDSLMIEYFELLVENEDIDQLKKDLKNNIKHPLVEKKRLARNLVRQFYNEQWAKKAEKEFERMFSQKILPHEIQQILVEPKKNIWICRLLKELNMIPSTAEGKRLIKNGGIRINSKKILEPDLKIQLNSGDEPIFQVGKRAFLKIKVK